MFYFGVLDLNSITIEQFMWMEESSHKQRPVEVPCALWLHFPSTEEIQSQKQDYEN